MPALGINIDHVATLRQARLGEEPAVLEAAQAAIYGGADTITVHLREDRRHIQDHDVAELRKRVKSLNLEMALSPDIVDLACQIKPDFACLVPEKREELTTEGGLDVVANQESLRPVIARLKENGIQVSLFVDPVAKQIQCAKLVGADIVEIHTGTYANAPAVHHDHQLQLIQDTAQLASTLGLIVNAGHGLNYENVRPVAQISVMQELNIGHSIVSRAVFVGLESAVREMKKLLI